MSTCLQCGRPVPATKTKPRRFCTGEHSRQWRRKHPAAPLPDAGAAGKWEALWHRLPEERELGPARPLLGMTAEEAREARLRRMLEAARDGVESDALAERFATSADIVRYTLKRHGVRLNVRRAGGAA